MTGTAENTQNAADNSDRHLLSRLSHGDLAAYEGIMRRYNQRLFRLARSIVTDDSAAMDIVQDAYISAYQQLPQLRDPDALGGWLAKIVRNTSLMHLRKTRRYLPMDEPEFEKVLHLTRPVQQQMRPDKELANTQLRKVLEDCIDELPDPFRSVFMLRAVEQCSTRTVADILDIKEATVKTRFHRARAILQEKLLAISDASSIGIHEFAGHRCDTIVRNVLDRLRQDAAPADRIPR